MYMKSYPTWFIMMWRKMPCFEFFTINLVGYFEAVLIHEANILIQRVGNIFIYHIYLCDTYMYSVCLPVYLVPKMYM